MTNKQPDAQFDWATELLDAEGHVTLSAKEAKEIGARLRSMGDPLVTAAPDVSGYVSEWASGICTADEAMAGIAKLYGAQAAPTTQPAPQQEAQEP